MDWIFDHIQIILSIAGAIAYWLNARKKEQAGEPADYDGDGEPDTRPQTGGSFREQDEAQQLDENTRRIQEEIRRKIAERQAESKPVLVAREVAPAPATPPTLPVAPAVRRRETASPYAMDDTRRATLEREAAAVLENQRALAEQLELLQKSRAETGRPAPTLREVQAAALAAKTAKAAERARDVSVLSDLRSARSLRKAIVLREVLGTPVGLR